MHWTATTPPHTRYNTHAFQRTHTAVAIALPLVTTNDRELTSLRTDSLGTRSSWLSYTTGRLSQQWTGVEWLLLDNRRAQGYFHHHLLSNCIKDSLSLWWIRRCLKPVTDHPVGKKGSFLCPRNENVFLLCVFIQHGKVKFSTFKSLKTKVRVPFYPALPDFRNSIVCL